MTQTPPLSPPRLPPLGPDQWDHDVRTLFTIYEGPEAYEKGTKYNVLRTLAHHPRLATSFLKFNGRMLLQAKLSPRLREIAILRVAHLCNSPYEWAQHVATALPLGLNAGHIEAIRTGADDPVWSPLEAQVIRATDQLKAVGQIDDATWDALSAELSRQDLLELLFFIGTYTLLSWVFNAIGLEVEAETTVADDWDATYARSRVTPPTAS